MMRLARRGVFALLVTAAVTFWYPTFRTAPSGPRWSSQIQPVSPACRASFDRDFTPDPAAPNYTASFVWATDQCPNLTYGGHVEARDAAGNVVSTPFTVTVLNLGREQLLQYYAKTRLYSGGGYLELIVQDRKRRQFGLSLTGDRFAWSVAVQFDTAMVIESGAVVSIRTAPNGSVFRLAVANGVVTYERNGAEFYRSQKALAGSAQVEVALEDAATLPGRLTIAGGSGG